MERLRQVKIMLVLVLLCSVAGGASEAAGKTGDTAPRKRAKTKSINILLQEGLYAEETEGDLDKAIEIYEQVVEEASYYQRIAARATYRLGLCYLKKGQKETAADYFRKVVRDFPDQELQAKRAQQQLDEIAPPAFQPEALLPWEVYDYILKRHFAAGKKASELKIASNTHMYGVDDMFNLYSGGYIDVFNMGQDTWTEPRKIAQFTCNNSELDLYNEKAEKQVFEWKEAEFYYGRRCQLIWTPDKPVKPGEFRVLGYKYREVKKLPETSKGHQLIMQNHFGAEVIESFFLVLPTNLVIAEKTSDITSHQRFGFFDIYEFQRRVPADTNNQVTVVVARGTTTSINSPSVIETFPANFSNDVPCGLTEITVTFDRKMLTNSYAWCRIDQPYPELTGKPHFSSDTRSCSLPVKLKPGTAYYIGINIPPYQAFRGFTGSVANEYVLVFATKDADGNPTQIPPYIIAKAKEINAAAAPPSYTQELTGDIKPDGTLKFKTTVRSINEGPTKTTTSFINSDFVNVTAMWDEQGKPLKFRSTHEGNIYRYHVTFNQPVGSGEMMVYSHEGTMTGLINPVPGTDDNWHYYMRHSPAADRPTLRVETFLLPEDAELVSTTPPDMQRTETNGRTELYVEEIIPPGGALTTAFQYRLTGAASPQFTSNIYDNTVLDLDTGAAVPLGSEWPDNLEIAWDNDGGGAIMINKEQSQVRFITLPTVKKGNWAEAVAAARRSIDILKTSTSSGVFANQTNFVAVLTSEGKLAVVEIGDHSPEQAEITWRLEKPITPTSGEPPKLNRAPWVDGEIMRLDLKTMAGMDMGELIYTCEAVEVEGEKLWRVESYMSIIKNYTQQYTRVDADLDSFSPVFGRTNNELGDFTARYKPDKVELTTITTAGKREQQIKLDSTVYDNEQALYLIRRLPLSEGYAARFSIFPVQSGTVSECRITVTGKERLSVSVGEFDCYAVELAVYSAQVKALEHKLWISADRHQYLVKYDSGQAIMELKEIGLKTKVAKKIELPEHALSFELPAGWYRMESPTMGMYTVSIQLIGPQMDVWGLLTGAEHSSFFASARDAADMDIEVLKGTFKNYTPRPESWKDLTVDTMPAVNFHADYLDKGKQMVEYRTYILGKSLIYWFVFRIEEDKFEDYKGRFDSIVDSFKVNREAVRKKKLDAENLSSKGWRLWNQGKFVEAEKLFEDAVSADPTLANAWNGLGWSQFKQDKNLNAKASFKKCLEIEPELAGALNGLAWIARAEGKTEEAIRYWEKAVEALPSATAALNGLTTTYMELKEFDKAIEYYKIWLRAEPDNADVKAGLQEAQLKAGKTRGGLSVSPHRRLLDETTLIYVNNLEREHADLFTIEGKTFKAGDTFDLDGNVKKVEDRWLIVGI